MQGVLIELVVGGLAVGLGLLTLFMLGFGGALIGGWDRLRTRVRGSAGAP